MVLNEICWRICQESVRNALKHGHATTIQIELTASGGYLSLTITDDGQGFDVDQSQGPSAGGGFGLIAMRQRVIDVGGSCEIISATGAGAQVAVMIPLPEEGT